MRIIPFLAATCFALANAQAAEFCATNASELFHHLQTAATNGQDDLIRVARGNYNSRFAYDTFAPVNGDKTFDLTIIGGYSEFFQNPCGVILDPSPTQTIIDADGLGRPLLIRAGAGATVEVRNLGFINGDVSTGTGGRGGGLSIAGSGTNQLERVRVENNLFLGNRADFESALFVSWAEFVEIRNNVMVANTAASTTAASIVTGAKGGHLINNTVVNNSTDGDGNGGIYVAPTGTAQMLLVNNILWGNDAHDLEIFDDAGQPTWLFNNSIESFEGTPEQSVGNLAVAPVFESGFLNFTPVVTSPLVDAGRKPPVLIPFPPPFSSQWTLPAQDLTGRTRVMGDSVDIGAVETFPDRIFADGFEA